MVNFELFLYYFSPCVIRYYVCMVYKSEELCSQVIPIICMQTDLYIHISCFCDHQLVALYVIINRFLVWERTRSSVLFNHFCMFLWLEFIISFFTASFIWQWWFLNWDSRFEWLKTAFTRFLVDQIVRSGYTSFIVVLTGFIFLFICECAFEFRPERFWFIRFYFSNWQAFHLSISFTCISYSYFSYSSFTISAIFKVFSHIILELFTWDFPVAEFYFIFLWKHLQACFNLILSSIFI